MEGYARIIQPIEKQRSELGERAISPRSGAQV
jgi:hypothetical protein